MSSNSHFISQKNSDVNIYRFVNQLEIESASPQGFSSNGQGEKRIPDGILYINDFPLVVFEFKSDIREQTPISEAFDQLSIRYHRAIPQLFVFNTLCVISDGVNNTMGNLFAPYQFFYWWGESHRTRSSSPRRNQLFTYHVAGFIWNVFHLMSKGNTLLQLLSCKRSLHNVWMFN